MKYAAPWWVRVEVRVLLGLCSLWFWLTIFFSVVAGLELFVIGRLLDTLPWSLLAIFLLGGGLAGVALFVLVGEAVDALDTRHKGDDDTRGGDEFGGGPTLGSTLSWFFWLGLPVSYWGHGRR